MYTCVDNNNNNNNIKCMYFMFANHHIWKYSKFMHKPKHA